MSRFRLWTLISGIAVVALYLAVAHESPTFGSVLAIGTLPPLAWTVAVVGRRRARGRPVGVEQFVQLLGLAWETYVFLAVVMVPLFVLVGLAWLS